MARLCWICCIGPLNWVRFTHRDVFENSVFEGETLFVQLADESRAWRHCR